MHWFVILFFLCAACGTQPAPMMFGGARHETIVDGRTFVVYRKGNRVEVIRDGPAGPGEHDKIRATMIEIVPWLTGCQVVRRSVEGDSGALRARVTCPRGRR
ncbi:hypothetical protein GCM10011452_34860 [Gemmobacter lanyuensis]|uniref:Uncharacterized protein n=1 Tax=Gemmobacter lanyuensis TaxID=1054497 RepID=A0A918J2D2_9RHOB|nr:hypothetical protein GCM10011452_34860 [Gemmobacter lanyuensis]